MKFKNEKTALQLIRVLVFSPTYLILASSKNSKLSQNSYDLCYMICLRYLISVDSVNTFNNLRHGQFLGNKFGGSHIKQVL